MRRFEKKKNSGGGGGGGGETKVTVGLHRFEWKLKVLISEMQYICAPPKMSILSYQCNFSAIQQETL